MEKSVRWRMRDFTDNERQLISLVNYVIVCGVISLFGIISNVINMVVFCRQGLDTSINISFFSLAVSDLLSLIFQQLYNIYINPLFNSLNVPIVYFDFQYITTALNREMFARITCLITAFITAERCMCVVYPLHVKRIITPKITTTIIIAIFTSTLISPFPVYFTSYWTWKVAQGSNQTLLGIAVTTDNVIAETLLFLSHGLFTLLGFLSVLTLTSILIYKLGHKNQWRQTANVDLEKAKSMSKRDRATINMVVVIAGILVVCYTPAALLSLAALIASDFSHFGTFSNLFHSCWSICFILENINSSVNIFLYYRMSSKYRDTFKSLFFM